MADKSKIQWCDATINPCYGCFPVSPACDHCYAARMAHRLGALTEGTHKDGRWTGKVNLFPERMEQALRWRKPRRIFVGSMTDLFHPEVPDNFLDRVFAYMALAKQHTFLLLTKRPERMREYLTHYCCDAEISGMIDSILGVEREDFCITLPLTNVILMTTIEDQPRADTRMPHLMALAGMGWETGGSVEPMLGAVNFRNITISDKGGIRKTWDVLCGTSTTHHPVFGGGGVAPGSLQWVICGGESGPNARPMHPDWARSLRDQCAAAGVPFFFKQWGEWMPCSAMEDEEEAPDVPYGFIHDDGYFDPGQDGMFICRNGVRAEQTFRVGKHRAGRLLDGVEHNAFPEMHHG